MKKNKTTRIGYKILYKKLENTFNIIKSNQKYGELVWSNGNDTYPVQRWFQFKEAYSLKLLSFSLTDWGIDILKIKKVLDPFCGTGTTFLALQELAKEYGVTNIKCFGF